MPCFIGNNINKNTIIPKLISVINISKLLFIGIFLILKYGFFIKYIQYKKRRNRQKKVTIFNSTYLIIYHSVVCKDSSYQFNLSFSTTFDALSSKVSIKPNQPIDKGGSKTFKFIL